MKNKALAIAAVWVGVGITSIFAGPMVGLVAMMALVATIAISAS